MADRKWTASAEGANEKCGKWMCFRLENFVRRHLKHCTAHATVLYHVDSAGSTKESHNVGIKNVCGVCIIIIFLPFTCVPRSRTYWTTLWKGWKVAKKKTYGHCGKPNVWLAHTTRLCVRAVRACTISLHEKHNHHTTQSYLDLRYTLVSIRFYMYIEAAQPLVLAARNTREWQFSNVAMLHWLRLSLSISRPSFLERLN